MAKKIIIEMDEQDAHFLIRDLKVLVDKNNAKTATEAKANLSTRYLLELLKARV